MALPGLGVLMLSAAVLVIVIEVSIVPFAGSYNPHAFHLLFLVSVAKILCYKSWSRLRLPSLHD